MGSGGGPSNSTSTTTNRLPPYATKYAKEYLKGMFNQAMPGGQPGPSPLPYQQVAPFTKQQTAGMQGVSQQAGGAQQALNEAQAQQAATAGGAYLGPNPYLQDYYNAAALPMTQDYQQAIAPNIVAEAVRSGGIGGSGEQANFANAQSSLAQGLGTLGANIYEPAYVAERQLQQGADQNAPNMAAGQFVPSQELMQSGQTGQQQAQNVLNTGFQNLNTRALWPYQEMQMAGGAIPTAVGGAGNQVTVGPSQFQGGMK